MQSLHFWGVRLLGRLHKYSPEKGTALALTFYASLATTQLVTQPFLLARIQQRRALQTLQQCQAIEFIVRRFDQHAYLPSNLLCPYSSAGSMHRPIGRSAGVDGAHGVKEVFSVKRKYESGL
jgi:hypothetical protein